MSERGSRAYELLSGVVADELLEPYSLLVDAGPCDEAVASERVGPALDFLTSRGMVGRDGSQVVPQSPDVVLQTALAEVMEGVVDDQQRYINGYRRLASPAATSGSQVQRSPAAGTARVISDPEEVREVEVAVARAVRDEWLSTDVRVSSGVVGGNVVRREITVRSVPADHALDQVVASGVQVRLLPRVGLRMRIADETCALLFLSDGMRLLHVRAPVIIRALREYFALLWERAVPVIGDGHDCPLPPARFEVLRLLAQGLSDDAIAQRLQVTRSTVRRHGAAIREELGVTTRFAAGAEAARRGWIG